MRVHVALVDDHLLFREALSFSLSARDIEVVGGAGDARAAYALLEETDPDVTLVDLALPGVNGVAVTREIQRRRFRTKVLVLTMHPAEDYASDVMGAGAAGFARKSQSIDDIVDAILTVARGERYLCPEVPASLVERHVRHPSGAVIGPLSCLSRREREIFDLILQGRSNKDMAHDLSISIKTVETHRANINRKLDVHSTAELMRFATTRGLVAAACHPSTPMSDRQAAVVAPRPS